MSIEEEIQLAVHQNLQKLISGLADFLQVDAITITNYVNGISGLYLKDMRKAYKKMVKDRAKFEEEIVEDLKKLESDLSETVEKEEV